MCSLCGVLGTENHWTDAAGGRGAFPGAYGRITRRQERQRRVALASRILSHQHRIKLGEWQGQYILQTPTGRSELVPDLGRLWTAAERLTGRRCDPLDLTLIEALERG